MTNKHQFRLIPDSDPVLRQAMPTHSGSFEEIRDMLESMFAFMRASSGMGLAAPQVGMIKNFFIMETDGTRRCVVNPIIVEQSKATNIIIEGCLSFPGKRIPIKRSAQITVAYENEHGEFVTETLNGITARCFLHEADHLKGKVFTEYETERSNGI